MYKTQVAAFWHFREAPHTSLSTGRPACTSFTAAVSAATWADEPCMAAPDLHRKLLTTSRVLEMYSASMLDRMSDSMFSIMVPSRARWSGVLASLSAGNLCCVCGSGQGSQCERRGETCRALTTTPRTWRFKLPCTSTVPRAAFATLMDSMMVVVSLYTHDRSGICLASVTWMESQQPFSTNRPPDGMSGWTCAHTHKLSDNDEHKHSHSTPKTNARFLINQQPEKPSSLSQKYTDDKLLAAPKYLRIHTHTKMCVCEKTGRSSHSTHRDT